MIRYFYLILILSFLSCEKDDLDEFIIEDVVEEIQWSPIQFVDVDPALSTPAQGSEKQINVVVINYVPTNDNGVTVNQNTFPFAGDNGVDPNLTVEEYNKWVLSQNIRTKVGIEEGSKFRGYKNNNDPYIGINVLKYINVYEMPKIVREMPGDLFAQDSTEGYYPDYFKLFESIGLESLVNEHDVKEVWFNRKSLAVPESNMSSPSSGDISNAYYGSSQYGFSNTIQEDDLPIYDKTFVVYSHWMHNSYEAILHVRGHQIERQLDVLEGGDFLWGKFKGFSVGPDGREHGCGPVHYPVNATSDYQYNNDHHVLSDIEDWEPDGSGERTLVNSSNWIKEINIPYNLPTSYYKSETSRDVIGNDPEGGWMIYWFQSIPGEDNNLQYNGLNLKNWWDTLYDWDYHYTQSKRLLE
jgi:hypothetical protein